MLLTHYDHDGRARFVTFGTRHQIPLLSNDSSRQAVVDSIAEARACAQFSLLGWVIMPDHVHLVIVPPSETELGGVIGVIKRESTRRIHVQIGRHGGYLIDRLTTKQGHEHRFSLWYKRCFDKSCRNVEEVRKAIEYCHNNPVRAGLIKSAEQWEWSSCRWYAGIRGCKLEMDTEAIET